jgi:hypothetical protein
MKTDIIKKRQRYESNTNAANAGGRKNSGKKSKNDIVPSSPAQQEEEMIVSPTPFHQPLYTQAAGGFNPPFTQPGYQPTFDSSTTNANTPIIDDMMSNNYF